MLNQSKQLFAHFLEIKNYIKEQILLIEIFTNKD